MSIVAVHGTTMYSAGTGNVTAPQTKATGDPTNGLKFTFEATNKARPAADYDWAFPGGTPATATDSQGPIVVTYATAGAKTATLTIAAGAGPPAGGAYPISVQAVGTGGPRSLMMEGGDGGDGGETPPPAEPFDPTTHTVQEVKDYVTALPDDDAWLDTVDAIITAEEAGANRVTLVTWLDDQVAAHV